MRRALAGFRAARIRLDRTVRTTAVLGVALLLTGCGALGTQPASAPVAATTAAGSTAPASTAPPSMAPSTTAPPTTAPPTSTAPETVQVPTVTGLTTARAQAALRARGLAWKVVTVATSRFTAGTVYLQSPRGQVRPGSTVTLTVATAPPPKPTPRPTPPPSPEPTAKAPADCDPSYPGVCLKTGIGDYDCSSGSGNGPNYTSGPIKVLPPAPFDLDADGDGWGGERG